MKKTLLIIFILLFFSLTAWISWNYFSREKNTPLETPPQTTEEISTPSSSQEGNGSTPDILEKADSQTSETSQKVNDSISPSLLPPDTTQPTTDPLSDPIQRNALPEDANVLLSVTTTHCMESCQAYEHNLVYYEYCRNVCGFDQDTKVSLSDCKDKDGLRRDYCLKDAGINARDASLCKEIRDDNIQKTCTSRITEEILEEM